MKHEGIYQHCPDYDLRHVHPDRGVAVKYTVLETPETTPGEILWMGFSKVAEMVARNPEELDEWQRGEVRKWCETILVALDDEN